MSYNLTIVDCERRNNDRNFYATAHASTRIEELVYSNLDLIEQFKKGFKDLDNGDVESEANVGLFVAAKAFSDGNMEGDFRLYARKVMYNAIRDLYKSRRIASKHIEDQTIELALDMLREGHDVREEIKEGLAVESETVLVEDADMLREFYYRVCSDKEKHVLASYLLAFSTGEKITQVKVCEIMSNKFHDTCQRSGLCKRIQAMKEKFFQFVACCERGEVYEVA